MSKFALAAVFALLFVACGATSGSGSPSPSVPRGSFDVTATEKDHAVTMHVGQTLEVALHGGTTASWQQIKSNDTVILRPIPDVAGGMSLTLAAFKAEAAGNTTVTAVGIPVCPSGQACPMYAMLYSLSVSIMP